MFVPPTGVHAMHGVLKRDFNAGLKIWFYFNRGKVQRGKESIGNNNVYIKMNQEITSVCFF